MFAICPKCGRRVPIEDSWLARHREDPPSPVICSGSGTYVDEWHLPTR